MTRSAQQIRDNLAAIQQRIREAATNAGRTPGSIRLVAVSKFVPAEAIEHAMAAGQFSFGENYLQEALQKQSALHDNRVEWHFIGHLQTNKAKQACGSFSWLHSLDSLRLAERLAAGLRSPDQVLNLLLQVNVAEDPGKSGLQPGEVPRFAEALLRMDHPGLRLRGLMTIGRLHADVDERRGDFAALRELSERCAGDFGREYFTELSMGMSDDFEIAIGEGATILRIGTAIFGPRTTAARQD